MKSEKQQPKHSNPQKAIAEDHLGDMKSGMDALQKSSMKIGEVMYKAQTENSADASEKPQDPPKDDGIFDGDYKKMD